MTHIKIINLHLGSPAPEVHHFSPLITHSPLTSSAVASILVASEEATLGSVIPNADLISPPKRGFNQVSFCSSEPYLTSTSIFPVSGALQFIASEAKTVRPISSARCAYSKFDSPAPNSLSGKNRFQRPLLCASFFSSSNSGCGFHLSFSGISFP